MLIALAAAALAQAEPEPPPPAAPVEAIPVAPPVKSTSPTREICLTKALSPKEKKSCCRNYPDLCTAPAPPPG